MVYLVNTMQVSKHPDMYVQNPALLMSQPKRAIAEYVKKHGILVPDIYDSWKDAVKSGKQLLVRSEHPQDYSGASDLIRADLSKYSFLKGEADMKKKIRKDSWKPKEYCKYYGLNLDDFWANVSFSFWEKINGVSIKIVADSAIDSRYHIFSKKDISNESYTIFGDGETLAPKSIIPKDKILDLVKLYEDVRNLPNFSPLHCPIIEAKLAKNGKLYFLQYHRARDFEAPNFCIDKPPKPGTVFAAYVRGATPKDGYECNATLHRCAKNTLELPKDEIAAFNQYTGKVLSEIMSRLRKVHIFMSDDAIFFPGLFKGMDDHEGISRLFKPQVSLYVPRIPFKDIYGGSFDNFDFHEPERKNFFVPLKIIADGRIAYVEIVGKPFIEEIK
ncbi:MAG: hypothetical protein WC263_04175 [Candidatus Micrarchaeia archaeon]|jgi:hypothetical protein